MVLRNLFTWQYSGVTVPFLYGLGVGLWGIALSTDPYLPLFCAAGLLFLFGFIWSIGWLWTHELFGSSRHRLKEGKQLKILCVASLLFAFPFISFEAWLLISYKAHAAEKEFGKVEISFSESRRFPATELPFENLQHGLSALTAGIRISPMHRLILAPNMGKVVMSVIVRNTSDVPIRNAHITFMSNVPISGKTLGALPFSDESFSVDERVLRPFSRLGEEYMISVEFKSDGEIPVAGLTVSIEADNMKPYVGEGVFSFSRAH